MKKCYLIGILCLASFLILSFKQAQNEPQIKEHFEEKCNCIIRQIFYDNGKVQSYEELDTVDYSGNGIQVFFNDSGDTVNVAFYKDGQENGPFYSKFKNGKSGITGQYKNGNKTGIWRYFSDNGSIFNETIYDTLNTNPESNHLVKYYGENEILVYSEQFKDYHLSDTKVYDQILYDKVLEAKENITGEQIFQTCMSCHNPKRDATGPKLTGITKRRTDKWLAAWISNSAKLIAEGDPEAVKLYNQWNKTSMTVFPLPKKDMDKLIGYLRTLK